MRQNKNIEPAKYKFVPIDNSEKSQQKEQKTRNMKYRHPSLLSYRAKHLYH